MPTTSCLRLLIDNYADNFAFSSLDASSEQSSFPATNVTARKRRAKSWRTGGYWNIELGSNTIIFQEDGATDLTATIPDGAYSSTTSLLAAIKAAFENTTTSGVTYTVSIDATTNKIKIESDGNGGATLDILWTDAGSTDMAAILGFSSDDTGALSYVADTLKIATEEFLLFDLGLPTTIEAFALVGERNEPIALSPSATIKLQASETDEWVTPSFETTLSYDGNSILYLTETGIDSGTMYRYWRVSIVDNENANGYIEINAVFLGNQFRPTNGRAQFPLTSGLQDASVTVTAEGGNTFSSNKPRNQNYQVRWFNLSKQEVEDIEDLWQVYGTSQPLFLSLDTAVAWSSSQNRRLIMARFSDEPSWQLERPNLFTMTMSFVEEI